MGFLATRAPSAKFAGVGSTVRGVIVDARQVQTSEYKTQRPEYWEAKAKTFNSHASDGTPNEPKAQLEVTLETGEADESGETERRVFIKNKRQFDALREALKKARARQGLVIGGSLAVTLTGKVPTDEGQDANTWEMEYAPPAEGAPFSEVPEEVHLVGGGTWRRGQPAQRVRASFDNGPQPVPDDPDPGLAQRTGEVIAQLGRAHQSSPLAGRLGLATRPVDEEPPF